MTFVVNVFKKLCACITAHVYRVVPLGRTILLYYITQMYLCNKVNLQTLERPIKIYKRRCIRNSVHLYYQQKAHEGSVSLRVCSALFLVTKKNSGMKSLYP